MAYQAIVCELTNVREHPNADRLKLATVQGYQIIIGLDQQEGDLGVFFPGDGMIMKDHLLNNKLYARHPDTGEEMGGYFGKNGRVRTQKFRGQPSEGFWQPLSAFEWTGDTSQLTKGYQFDTLNGHRICKKYFTPATLRAINKEKNARKGKAPGMKTDRSMLHEHYDTKQVRHYISAIPEGAILYISEKIHGTSGRTGRIKSIYPLVGFKRWWNKWFPMKFESAKWEYVSGTRRVVLDPDVKTDNGYYSGTSFRQKIHKEIESMGLHKGEILYYEIVGFDDKGRPIMPAHKVEDKKLKKKYSEQMQYTYGCDSPECNIYVYRIAHVNEEGFEIDLPWSRVITRCRQLGLKTVPYLEGPILHTTEEELLEKLNVLANGSSTLDSSHIREGVVVRVEDPDFFECLKYKGFWFCELENIMKNSDEFIDPEEIA